MEIEKFYLPNHGIKLPKFHCPQGMSSKEYLMYLCKERFQDRIDLSKVDIYRDRLDYEISVLEKTHFIDYILLVWDAINFCAQNKLSYGVGRGSAAGSLVNYILGITDIDPIENKLYFERFISVARAKMKEVDGQLYLGGVPDIDTDFGDEDRDILLGYLKEKYKGKFVKLSTINTLSTRILIKDVGKVVGGFDEEQMNSISGCVESLFGNVDSLEDTYDKSEKFKNFCDKYPLIYSIAKKLHGLNKSIGSHPSAYLVCEDDLGDFIPLILDNNGEEISCYDMYVASDMAVKLDLLALKTIPLIYNTAKSVGIDLKNIPLQDYDKIYKHLENLDCPYGLFQISGHSAIKGLHKIKPKNTEQLSGVLAICRPGALAFIDQYADYTNNNHVTSLDPLFDDILGPTGGICLYQESLMAMFCKIGFNLVEADSIRRIVGKKLKSEIKEWEAKIYAKAKENGVSENAAKLVWDIANASASYSFNKSHSDAYSKLTAMSVYLKFNYPQYFFIEALKMAQKRPDFLNEIYLITQELHKFNIKLLPPDIIKSDMDFKIEGNNIRFGISSIKGISDKSIEKINKFIDAEKTTKLGLFQVAKDNKMNIAILSSLIQAGAIQSIGENRPKLALEAQVWYKLTDRERARLLALYPQDCDLIELMRNYESLLDASGKRLIKDSRIETIRKECGPNFKSFQKNKEHPRLANYFYEKKALGYSYSQKLKDIFVNSSIVNIEEVKKLLKDDWVEIVGEVMETNKGRSKADKEYLKILVGDETGSFEVMLFGDNFTKYKDNNGQIPEAGEILYCRGRKGDDIIWASKIETQLQKIETAF